MVPNCLEVQPDRLSYDGLSRSGVVLMGYALAFVSGYATTLTLVYYTDLRRRGFFGEAKESK